MTRLMGGGIDDRSREKSVFAHCALLVAQREEF